MDAGGDSGRMFTELDGVSVLASWESPLAHALLGLFRETSPEDRAILRHFAAFMARNAGALAALDSPASILVPSGSYREHPVGVTLLALRDRRPSPGLIRLTAILVSAGIEATNDGRERNRIAELGSMLRGALDDQSSTLRVALANSCSISDLIRIAASHVDSGKSLHPGFERLWKAWLGDTLTRWVLADPGRIRRSLESQDLMPSIEAPLLALGGGSEVDGDDGTELENCPLEETPADEDEAPQRVQILRSKAEALVRASAGDLLQAPDTVVPDELVARLVARALQLANGCLQRSDRESAEPSIALALATATGLREQDLGDVVWGNEASPAPLVLDLSQPVLHRSIKRPPNAVNPPEALLPWLEPVADRVPWPISPSLHTLLYALAPTLNPTPGANVLPLRASSLSPPYRLRDVVADLEPGLAIGAGRVRLALAVHLARRLGPDMAQTVLGDTFSMSVAPTYYSAVPASGIAAAAADIQRRWFAECPAATGNWNGFVGSRLVLKDEAASRWPTLLRSRLRSAVHRKDNEISAWTAHRDHLVAALCAITGHRPEDGIGRIDLDQVIPEYALILLRDKQADALRATRIAATGRRWLADLRDYLDRLVKIAETSEGPGAVLAASILRSESPLFSVPGDDGTAQPMTAALLRATMPQELQSVANHYRHRLNQYLQRRGVDPELRHAQLGWVITPAHAMADMSPLSPCDLASRVGPVLDDLLAQDDWYPATLRTSSHWDWRGIPLRPLKDWAAVIREHEAEHKTHVRTIAQQLRERGEEAKQRVLPRLAQAVIEFLPGLRLNQEVPRLEPSTAHVGRLPIEVTSDQHGLICDRVRRSDEDPASAIEAIATRLLLYRLIRGARREGLVRGPIPSQPRLSVTAQLSPFPPGIGLAVRHAEALRHAMLARAKLQKADDQGPLVMLAVLAHSPYREWSWAMAAVGAAARGLRNREPGDWYRVPAVIEQKEVPMVFSGLPALMLARRGQTARTARAPDVERVAQWMRTVLGLPFALPADDQELASRVGDTLKMAGRLELAGPERTVMLDQLTLAAVPAERSLARDDQWPVRTRLTAEDESDTAKVPTYARANGAGDARGQWTPSGYARLTAVLSPDVPTAPGEEKSGKHQGWRKKLKDQLRKLRDEAGEKTNLGLLAGFSLHRARYGGERVKKLERRTLHGELTRFGRDLLTVLGRQPLVSMESEQIHEAYVAVVRGKRPGMRAQALEAMRMFHRFLEEVHQVPEVSFEELAILAGPRIRFAEAGMLTDHEVHHAFQALQDDLRNELARKEASPDGVRLCSLRILYFLILEASGIRPSSAHGLTVGDLHLLGQGRDFVHVHRTGDYGEAKTSTSEGFVSLEGMLWQANREWVLRWLRDEKSRLAGAAWHRAPLFADTPGSARRFSRAYVTVRCNGLLKWVSGDSKAKVYWLRKNRVTERHRTVVTCEASCARDVNDVLREGGHADILVALLNYVSDPAVVMRRSLREGRSTPRAFVLGMTGLDGPQLDMAWQRDGGSQGPRRLAVALDRLEIPHAQPHPERLTPPPTLRRHVALSPQHIDTFARAMHHFRDRDEAILRAGLTDVQADRLDQVATQMLIQRGQVPWPLPDLKHPRAVMLPARPLAGTQMLFDQLGRAPDENLALLSDAWVRQGHVDRIHDTSVVMCLGEVAEIEAAHRFILATSIRLEIDAGVGGAQALRSSDLSGKSHAPAFAWVLAIQWLYARFVESAARRP